MTKTFCDRCGKEIFSKEKEAYFKVWMVQGIGSSTPIFKQDCLCLECVKSLKRWTERKD